MTPLADQLQGFPRNTRWYAAHWIVSGERHPQEHRYISERLVRWRQQAAGCRGELRPAAQSILAEFERDREAEARQAREWIMPAPAAMPTPSHAVGQDARKVPDATTDTPRVTDNVLELRPRLREGTERACSECGTHYRAVREDAHLCSPRCRQRAARRAA